MNIMKLYKGNDLRVKIRQITQDVNKRSRPTKVTVDFLPVVSAADNEALERIIDDNEYYSIECKDSVINVRLVKFNKKKFKEIKERRGL